jgi:hypothetical protein
VYRVIHVINNRHASEHRSNKGPSSLENRNVIRHQVPEVDRKIVISALYTKAEITQVIKKAQQNKATTSNSTPGRGAEENAQKVAEL